MLNLIIVLGGIISAFALFAVTLAWADRTTNRQPAQRTLPDASDMGVGPTASSTGRPAQFRTQPAIPPRPAVATLAT